MSNALKFCYMDFLTVRRQLFINLSLFAVSAFLINFTNSTSVVHLLMVFTISSSMAINMPFSWNLDLFYHTLSFKKSHTVLGRYLFVSFFQLLVLAFCGGLIFIKILLNKFLYAGDSISAFNIMLSFSLAFSIINIVFFLELPVYFKLGSHKAGLLSTIISLLYVAVIVVPMVVAKDFFENAFSGVHPFLENYPFMLVVIPVCLYAVTFFISYFLSCKFYAKRDL